MVINFFGRKNNFLIHTLFVQVVPKRFKLYHAVFCCISNMQMHLKISFSAHQYQIGKFYTKRSVALIYHFSK